jgi:hypothetical protein
VPYDPATDKMGELWRSSATGELFEILLETTARVEMVHVFTGDICVSNVSTFDKYMVREP